MEKTTTTHRIDRKTPFKSKGPELLSDLADHCAHILRESAGLDKEKAEQIGFEIANKMADQWGGLNLYFPRGLSLQLSKRDRLIFSEFDGKNHWELAHKYGVSLQWIYKILKKEQEARAA